MVLRKRNSSFLVENSPVEDYLAAYTGKPGITSPSSALLFFFFLCSNLFTLIIYVGLNMGLEIARNSYTRQFVNGF